MLEIAEYGAPSPGAIARPPAPPNVALSDSALPLPSDPYLAVMALRGDELSGYRTIGIVMRALRTECRGPGSRCPSSQMDAPEACPLLASGVSRL
ncbi:hypothetical protein AAFF_G00047580 [Aldrovandia affinis]|uniref:Uncharacterized protein n=1 Tax=Aldrovandia affinis TaxID=143900 RepID=A0AAD7S1Q0_9TELE|nr:hypothetical protein AAFF_G00047580 [Aldrovandia affinis]